MKTQREAQQALEQLKGGADFVQTAKSLSIDEGSAWKGGDLGWVRRGTMQKAFEDAAFALKLGEVSDPVETPFGWHIIKLEDRRLAEADKSSPASGMAKIAPRKASKQERGGTGGQAGPAGSRCGVGGYLA